MEIYAGSPSYLITAGGEPANHAIPGVVIVGGIRLGFKDENKGVAVPISFMPTGFSADRIQSMIELAELVGMPTRPISLSAVAEKVKISKPFSFKELSAAAISPNESQQLIQLLRFSDQFLIPPYFEYRNSKLWSGPRFCMRIWLSFASLGRITKGQEDGIYFVNKKSHNDELAGFFLAIIKQGNFMLLEAFDTWLHKDTTFEQFKDHLKTDNPHITRDNKKLEIQLKSGQEVVYTTFFGNKIHLVIWNSAEISFRNSGGRIVFGHPKFGSKIIDIEYGSEDQVDILAQINAVKYTKEDESRFLSGSILKSVRDDH